MHTQYLTVGSYIHVSKLNNDPNDTFGVRIKITSIKTGILIGTCLSHGERVTLRYTTDQNQQVHIQNYGACRHLADTAGITFIQTREDFFKEEIARTQLALNQYRESFDLKA